MKRVLAALCILSLLAIGGCSDNTASMTPEQKQTISELEAKLDQITKQFDDLKAQAAAATGEFKTALDKAVDEGKAKLSEAQDKLEELKKASAQEWEKAKANVDEAFRSASATLTQNLSLPSMPKLPGQ